MIQSTRYEVDERTQYLYIDPDGETYNVNDIIEEEGTQLLESVYCSSCCRRTFSGQMSSPPVLSQTPLKEKGYLEDEGDTFIEVRRTPLPTNKQEPSWIAEPGKVQYCREYYAKLVTGDR